MIAIRGPNREPCECVNPSVNNMHASLRIHMWAQIHNAMQILIAEDCQDYTKQVTSNRNSVVCQYVVLIPSKQYLGTEGK